MKKVIAMALLAAAAGSALAQVGVGVSVGINAPGVYGRVNIGPLPGVALVAPQPVVIEPPAVVLPRQPIYLYVPPEHQRDWRRYCGRYNACGQPVYFVREDYVHERYGHEHPQWHGDEHGHDRDRGRDRDHRGERDHDRRD